jgi:flagellar basal-body rod protein FlgF
MADITTLGTVMNLQVTQLEHISNNIANTTTPGFKAVHLNILKSIEEIIQTEEAIEVPSRLTTDFSQGIPQNTGNVLDVHIQGSGFFVVQSEKGDAYTKNGAFSINPSNQIVTQDGHPVIGDSGPITLTNGEIHIAHDGTVLVDGSEIGKLKVVDFSDPQALVKSGGNLYYDEGGAGLKPVEKPSIQSGFLELSNVNVIREMTDMISVNRLFETYQKMIQTLQEQDRLAVSRIGKLF